MNIRLKIVFWCLMLAGFIFGYAGLVIPGQTAILETPRPGELQYQRLHVFLFNLVTGGTVLLYFTEGKGRLTWRVRAFLVAALAFSVLAFLDRYLPVIILAAFLVIIVESVRIEKYAFFPSDFFKSSVPIARKFQHAALLCLSIGLFICAVVILDNQYLHFLNLPLLLLDDFFLGFSFPISLVTFGVMFSLTVEDSHESTQVLRDASFWIVTVGVIIFFVFIVLNIVMAELVIAIILLLDTLLIFYLFRIDLRNRNQPEEFLTSGMGFLILTGVTGLLLALWEIVTPNDPKGRELLLQTHAYLSLYGWNLAGLTVLIHYREFPLHLNELEIILLHWVTVVLLAPLGSLYPIFAVAAIPAFALLTGLAVLKAPEGSRRSHDGKIAGEDPIR
jgi:hypothetical protein